MTLERLALSRSTLDRSAHLRADPQLIPGLLADPATAVLVLDGDQAPVTDGNPSDGDRLASGAADGDASAGGGAGEHTPQLTLLTPAAAAELVAAAGRASEPLAAYLGRDAAGRDHVVLALAGRQPVVPVPTPQPPADDLPSVPPPAGTRWAGLRELGTVLDDTGAGMLTAAVGLGHWHAAHPRCSRCGELTDVIQAGWARSCPACGTEHYPRTDPAVIMAVVDADGRILLGRQAKWPAKRFSTLAGFVEPGEPLEAAVRREVFEEAGVVVGDVAYQGSQPWPFPSSLMLGFIAQATSTEVTVDGAELAEASWWTREQFEADIAAGELLLPPPVSISRRLVEAWYGGPVNDGGDAWR